MEAKALKDAKVKDLLEEELVIISLLLLISLHRVKKTLN
jgi:hypothetical protein